VSTERLTLTTYFGERDRTPDRLLADELLDVFGAHGVRASILLRGADGYGRGGRLRTDRLLSLSEDLPVIAIAVDEAERIETVLEKVLAIRRHGLVTLERTRMLSGDAERVELPAELGEAAKLTVYLGRGERAGRTPAHVAVCALLHARGIDGATVLLGVDGTRGGHRERAAFFATNARVPVMVVAVGRGELIAAVAPELATLVAEPVITLERVRVCKRDGQLLARPHELPASDEHGRALHQKLVIHTSAAATHGGRPLHLEILHGLAQAGAAGATSVRGVWGFHGRHAPHGDRVLALRRHVPVLTTTIDTPARTERSFEVIDELTREHGLVTSEMVPAIDAGELAAHRY
jgi:PII-like signaling protein